MSKTILFRAGAAAPRRSVPLCAASRAAYAPGAERAVARC